MGSYDEDLFDNPFFVAVHKQYTELFNQAIAKKALVRDLTVLCWFGLRQFLINPIDCSYVN